MIASCGGESFRPAVPSQFLRICKASSSGNLGTSTKFSSENKDYKRRGEKQNIQVPFNTTTNQRG